MQVIRIQELFESYFHYWTVKLKLHKKYKFIIRKDNRLTCHAWVNKLEQKNHYEVRYNPSMLTSEYKIINTVLHELSHVLVDWRHTDPVLDEAEAEYFALSTMKEFYPKLYKKALNWTKRTIEDNTTDIVHKEGYIQTLQKLKELPKD